MDVFAELEDIGRMLASASMLSMVRQEVGSVMRNGFVVTDGSHQEGASEYDVVVRCGSGEEDVSRRLREKMPEVDVSRIADGVIGLRRARRVRNAV